METNEELSKRTGQPNDVAFYQQHKESCDRLMEVARVHERDIIAGREEIHEKYHELNDKDIEARARADQFRKDTDERVQSIKETKIETIKQIKTLLDKMLQEVD